MLKPTDISTTRLAVLIDCDNARPSAIGGVIAEAAKYGGVTVRRGYGDWTTKEMAQWKKECHANSIQPIQQFRYTKGKNATDSALIIDAMDLLHGGRVEGFCIVSSDSDFTRLATRIREQGMFVMGVGKSQTPKPFVQACVVFAREDDLVQDSTQGDDVRRPQQGGETTRIVEETTEGNEKSEESDGDVSVPPEWPPIVQQAIAKLEEGEENGGNGWVSLSGVANYIRNVRSSFDTRTYGAKNLSTLVKTRPDLFSTKGWKNKGASHIEIRIAACSPAAVSGAEPRKS